MFKRKRTKLLLLVGLLLFLAWIAPRILAGKPTSTPAIIDYGVANQGWDVSAESIYVLSFNMAHGRSNGRNQMLVSTAKITSNLNEIVEMLGREQPDIVAFQEADKDSFWNGSFDHVGYVAEGADYRYSTHGENVQAPAIAYGAALLSQLPLQDALAVTFDENSPIPKGFVVSTIEWPSQAGLLVDVVSVHLDFSSSVIREAQIAEMAQQLAARSRPTIMIGDFNANLGQNRPLWQPLRDELDLTGYEMDQASAEFSTHHNFGVRIDWILISPEFQFVSHRVLDDVLSDHKLVSAEISLR